MYWFVFTMDYGLVFSCPDDTEGKDKVIAFIVDDMRRDFGPEPDDTDSYWVVRGEEKTFAPPSSRGDLV